MKKIADIAGRNELAEVVSEAVVETFTRMFGQDLAAGAARETAGMNLPNEVVLTYVKLSHNNEDFAFCFKFDTQLLLRAAEKIFSPEYIRDNSVIPDIACEIANIVGGKVKVFLKNEGYFTDMGFPFLANSEEAAALIDRKSVPMHFFFTGGDRKPGVGVAVDFIVS
jgi:CheY-specific phosphatase CheX